MVIQVQLSGNRKPPSWLVFVPGALFIALGLAILLLPKLLEFLVATFCLAIGVMLLLVPLKMRGMGPLQR